MSRKRIHSKHLIFAYGSNLCSAQMIRRCPGARLVGPAALPGGRLVFSGHSETWGGATATIVGDRKSIVYGAVWALTDEDRNRLDLFEGAPLMYDRLPVRVHVARRRGSPRQQYVETYVKPNVHINLPSPAYIERIREGYEELGLPVEELENILIDFYAMDATLSLAALGGEEAA